MNKIYKLKGLNYFAVGCISIYHAEQTFLNNRVGVTEENIELFNGSEDDIPTGSTVFEAEI